MKKLRVDEWIIQLVQVIYRKVSNKAHIEICFSDIRKFWAKWVKWSRQT